MIRGAHCERGLLFFSFHFAGFEVHIFGPVYNSCCDWLKNNYSKKGMCACYKYGLSHYAKNLVCYKIGDLYYTAVRLIFLKIYFWI
jgi:hypothetical protein